MFTTFIKGLFTELNCFLCTMIMIAWSVNIPGTDVHKVYIHKVYIASISVIIFSNEQNV